MVTDFVDLDDEFEILHSMAARSGRPGGSPSPRARSSRSCGGALLDRVGRGGPGRRGGGEARAIGILLGFEATLNPFMLAPAWKEGDLPMTERVARLRRDSGISARPSSSTWRHRRSPRVDHRGGAADQAGAIAAEAARRPMSPTTCCSSTATAGPACPSLSPTT